MKSSAAPLAAMVLMVAALGGCFGRTTGDPGTSASESPISGSSDLAARCAQPHGTAVHPATPAAFGRSIVGRWLACQYDPASISLLVAHEGIELTASGRYYLLDSDGHGGLQRASNVKVNQGDYPVTIEPAGSYSIYSAAAGGLVSAADDVPTTQLELHLNEANLGLDVSFEAAPRRFLTTNGIAMWFVSADPEPNDGSPRLAGEGEICGPEDGPCADGLACPEVLPGVGRGSAGQGVCTVPGAADRAQGCDNLGVRTCNAGLTCVDTCMKCGSFAGEGEPCDSDFVTYDFNACSTQLALCNDRDSAGTPLHCNRSAGRCAGPAPAGGWCDDQSHCASGNCDYGAKVCL